MRGMKSRIAVAVLATALTCFSWAIDDSAEKLLAQMREAYSKPKAVKISTEATIGAQSARSAETMSFELTFMRPHKVYCKVTKFPGQEGKNIFWVTDGKTLKSTNAESVRISPITPDEIGKGWPINLECLSFWDYDRQLSTKSGANMEKSKFKILEKESWNGKDWTVLEETAEGQDVFVRYFIDPSTHYIWRCEVWDIEKKNMYYDIKVTKLEIDPEVDPKIFEISKEGTR